MAEEEFATVTGKDWASRWVHIINTEKNNMENEHIIYVRKEQLIIDLTKDHRNH